MVREDITNMEQAQKLMSDEQNETLPDDSLQWKVWILPNAMPESGEALIILKIHHVISDGMGIMLAISML